MATFAVMEGNTVTNIILAENIEDAQAITGQTVIEYTEESPAGVGSTYDSATQTFSPQPVIEDIDFPA